MSDDGWNTCNECGKWTQVVGGRDDELGVCACVCRVDGKRARDYACDHGVSRWCGNIACDSADERLRGHELGCARIEGDTKKDSNIRRNADLDAEIERRK